MMQSAEPVRYRNAGSLMPVIGILSGGGHRTCLLHMYTVMNDDELHVFPV